MMNLSLERIFDLLCTFIFVLNRYSMGTWFRKKVILCSKMLFLRELAKGKKETLSGYVFVSSLTLYTKEAVVY